MSVLLSPLLRGLWTLQLEGPGLPRACTTAPTLQRKGLRREALPCLEWHLSWGTGGWGLRNRPEETLDLTQSRAPPCWQDRVGQSVRRQRYGRDAQDPAPASQCPERLCVPGADFTNTFYLLSSFPTGPESVDLAEFLTALTEQCASLEELRLAFRPQMDPRWVLKSCFLGICFRMGEMCTSGY